MKYKFTDIDSLLNEEIYPALYELLDTAFPEFGFVKKNGHWVATLRDGCSRLPGSPRPDRVYCYENSKYCIKIQGADVARWLDYVNGCIKPIGKDFLSSVGKLGRLTGISYPGFTSNKMHSKRKLYDDNKFAQNQKTRTEVLEAIIALCQRCLGTPKGESARAYLDKRGIDESTIKELEIGLFPDIETVENFLRDAGYDLAEAKKTKLLRSYMEGYIVFPWFDDEGHPSTMYGRYPGIPPAGKNKTMALPGEGSKSSPLYFHIVREYALKDVVLVEGLFDAASLHSSGFKNVIACMGAMLSQAQLNTLIKHKINSVNIALDQDNAGRDGTVMTIKKLAAHNITSYIIPALPEGSDPNDFLVENGPIEWQKLIDNSKNGLTWCSERIVENIKPQDGIWTERLISKCLENAVSFAEDVKNPKTHLQLETFFWPNIQKCAGISDEIFKRFQKFFVDGIETEYRKSLLKSFLNETSKKLEGKKVGEAYSLILKQATKTRKWIRKKQSEPIKSLAAELAIHNDFLAQWKGRKFFGIPQITIPKLDQMTMGLRGLILLAAAPNVGKTALAVQLGVDAVLNNPEVAFLFVSIEMTRTDIMTRIKSKLSEMDWKTLVFGDANQNLESSQNRESKINKVEELLSEVGDKIWILDDKNYPEPNIHTVLEHVDLIKKQTGVKRVIVLVDYLQVWPIPEEESRYIRSDIEADKWRIDQMKQLKDSLGGDPVIVISEARKPAGKDSQWVDSLADVMGAARGTYTPDIVFLQRDWTDAELETEFPGQKAVEIKKQHALQGFNLQKLIIVKGRDGVERGNINLKFYFKQSRFEEYDNSFSTISSYNNNKKSNYL